jgi:hypothetical protein
MTLSIYDTPTPGTGTQLWTENQTVGISNGVFSISVGAVNPIPASVFSSSSTYLEVDINGETPSAREQLLSGAYSFHSSLADYAVTVSPSIAVSTINAAASTPFGGVNITTSAFIQGNVGIGTTRPANLLTVQNMDVQMGDGTAESVNEFMVPLSSNRVYTWGEEKSTSIRNWAKEANLQSACRALSVFYLHKSP